MVGLTGEGEGERNEEERWGSHTKLRGPFRGIMETEYSRSYIYTLNEK